MSWKHTVDTYHSLEEDIPQMMKVTYRWLKRLSETPNTMWMTPRMTDIFILNEFRKVSLLVARFQICRGEATRKRREKGSDFPL